MIKSGAEIQERHYQAYVVGQLETLRVNLEAFMEALNEVPTTANLSRFELVVIAAEDLLRDISKTLNRPSVTVDQTEPTDAQVDAAIAAMVWEGSTVSAEEMATVMRGVLAEAMKAR